jgi:hypothetical protein
LNKWLGKIKRWMEERKEGEEREGREKEENK